MNKPSKAKKEFMMWLMGERRKAQQEFQRIIAELK